MFCMFYRRLIQHELLLTFLRVDFIVSLDTKGHRGGVDRHPAQGQTLHLISQLHHRQAHKNRNPIRDKFNFFLRSMHAVGPR